MSLDTSRTNTSAEEERHLQLYKDIERQILPQSATQQSKMGLSEQFFAATKKRKTGRIVAFTSLITTLLVVVGLQFIPWSELNPYRPTTLWSLGQKELVRQANALSDIMNYEKCVQQGGVIVTEEPHYCALKSIRYYQNSSLSEQHRQKPTPVLSTPLNVVSMNKIQLAQNIQSLQKGDIQYSGYYSDKAQYAGVLTLRSLFSMPEEQKQQLTQTARGEIPFDANVVKQFVLNASMVGDVIVVADRVETNGLETQLFRDYAAKTLLLRNTDDVVQKLYIVTLISNNEEIGMLLQQLNMPLVEAVDKGYQKLCSTLETPDAKTNCLIEKVLQDKSIAEKFASDLSEILKYFAFTS